MSDERDSAVTERVSADPRMPRIGERIAGRYEVLELLGEGGFAVVYLARDTLAGGTLAVKVLDPDLKAQHLDRFRQEVSLVRELRHPNTIKVWDFGATDNGSPFFAMEYLEGEPLDALLRRTGGLPPQRALRIAGQVLKSLAEAHDRGIVHRDLKPSNIMVCDVAGERDFVKVLDFGIAKALSPDLRQVKTQTGYFMCTPAYAAPELLRGDAVTPAADVFALGLIVAEMLTGRRIIAGESVYEIAAAQLAGTPVPLPDEVLESPVGDLLRRATDKDPTHRYVDARAMREAIERVDWPQSAALPSPQTPAEGFSRRRLGTGNGGASASTTFDEAAPRTAADRHHGDGLTRPLALAAIAIAFVSMLTVVVVLVATRGEPTEIAPPSGAETYAPGPPTPEEVAAPSPTTPEEVPAPGAATPEEAPAPSPVAPAEAPVAEAATAASAGSAAPPTPTPAEVEPAAMVAPGEAMAPEPSPPAPEPPPAHRVEVVITTVPAGADVVRDGEVLGRTPFDGAIVSDQDEVTLELRRSGYRSRTLEVDMGIGRQSVHERLRREERASTSEESEEPPQEAPAEGPNDETAPPEEAPAPGWDSVPRLDIRPGDGP